MTTRKITPNAIRRIVVLVLALLLCGVPALAITDVDATPAPDFTAVSYDGLRVQLSDYEGQVLVLHFWASWAPLSVGDAQLLQGLHDVAPNVSVVGINHFDPRDAALRFIANTGITYPAAPDPDGSIAIAYQVADFPTTVIIDPQGFVAQVIATPLTQTGLYTALGAWVEPPADMGNLIEAPVPADLQARYADIPVSRTDEGYYVLGEADAPVQILDYSSFACPFCLEFHNNVFLRLLDRVREGDVAFVYVPIYVTGYVPNSLEANVAALCAGEQDAFWQYADMLFDWQARYQLSAFDLDRLRQGAQNLGLDVSAWDTCFNGETMQPILDTAVAQLRAGGYTGTPTIVINGEQVPASLSQIEDAIDRITQNRI